MPRGVLLVRAGEDLLGQPVGAGDQSDDFGQAWKLGHADFMSLGGFDFQGAQEEFGSR